MTFDEREDVLFMQDYNEHVYVPNELFDILQKYMSGKELAFSFSYYFLNDYLYRYAKYSKKLYDVKMIKQLLGYSPIYKGVDSIIKKNGKLESMGLIETTREIPVGVDKDEDGMLEFIYLNELDEDEKRYLIQHLKINNAFVIKKPILSFEREKWEGSYYTMANTTKIDIKSFTYCMSQQELGVIGFYIYSYLKYRNSLNREGYDVSYQSLSEELNVPLSTTALFINSLEKHNLINVVRNMDFYSPDHKQEDRLANTYITNSSNSFRPDAKREIPKLKFKRIKKEQPTDLLADLF